MSYDELMMVAALIALLPTLLIARTVLRLGQRRRAIPAGRAAWSAYALIVCISYALLFLGGAVSLLILDPMRLQQRYLGRAYAGPLALRSYEHWGFQDPADRWIYALSPATRAELQRRCRPQRSPPGEARPARCSLHASRDKRRLTDIWLENDQLFIIDGVH